MIIVKTHNTHFIKNISHYVIIQSCGSSSYRTISRERDWDVISVLTVASQLVLDGYNVLIRDLQKIRCLADTREAGGERVACYLNV